MATVLVLDDDANVRRSLGRVIEAVGAEGVWTAASLEEALALTDAPAFTVAFIDVSIVLPEVIEAIEALRRRSPWMRVVLMSGVRSPGPIGPELHFVRKPFGVDVVRGALSNALGSQAS